MPVELLDPNPKQQLARRVFEALISCIPPTHTLSLCQAQFQRARGATPFCNPGACGRRAWLKRTGALNAKPR